MDARARLQEGREQFEPFLPPQLEIEESQIEALGAQRLQRLGAVGGLGDMVSHALQGRPQRTAQARFVVDDEQFQ